MRAILGIDSQRATESRLRRSASPVSDRQSTRSVGRIGAAPAVKRRPRRQEIVAEETGDFRIRALAATRGRRAAPTRWPLLGEGVAKHKCGSCHFFQEAGLAGSGWCHHPQRKVSSGVLIMVRRNELACRDEWSRSLWQPREGSSPTAICPSSARRLGPLPPALAENMRSVLNGDTALAASRKARTSFSARHGSFPRRTNPGSRRNGRFRLGISIRARPSSAPGRLTGSAFAQRLPRNVNRPARKRNWVPSEEGFAIGSEDAGDANRPATACRRKSARHG